MEVLPRSNPHQRSNRKMIPMRLSITSDDAKVIGHSTERGRDKLLSARQLQTHNMQTYISRWTPVVHKASNEQIFTERNDLISHWFDLWSDNQRKRFLDMLFRKCARSQYRYIQEWFEERVPLQHVDFTQVLPRFLSTYILSYLEPRSLCRAAQVCWHWKFLSEQDVIWQDKCLKYGWFVPYTPAFNENGAWKLHYVACVHSLDYDVLGQSENTMYGSHGDGTGLLRRKQKSAKLSWPEGRFMLQNRPPWQGPDYKPNDLQKSFHIFINQLNPNDPHIPKSAMIFHNRWGIVKRGSASQNVLAQSLDSATRGLDGAQRRQQHRTLMSPEDYDLTRTSQRSNLSQTMVLENPREKRLRELIEKPVTWKPDHHLATNRATLPRTGWKSGNTVMDIQYSSDLTPRVLFISSRVPASELLMDAVNFGVIPILYEHEGSTLNALLVRLQTVLDDRHAQSIGLFCPYSDPGEINLAHGFIATKETLDMPDIRSFFETIAHCTLPAKAGGQCNIFLPLGACEPGQAILSHLTMLTGTQFTAPTGIIGNYNHVDTDWLLSSKTGYHLPDAYFCPSKLAVWANVADQCVEAVKTCKQHLTPYFKHIHNDVVAQVTGEVVFDVLGQTDIQGVHKVTGVLADGLRQLGMQKNVNPLEFLGRFLLDKSGAVMITQTLKQSDPSLAAVKLNLDESDSEVKCINKEKQRPDSPASDYEEQFDDQIDEQIDEEEDSETEKKDDEKSAFKTVSLKADPEIMGDDDEEDEPLGISAQACRLQRLTADRLKEYAEKRSPVARELVASELQYLRLLQGLKDHFVKPLRAAIKSNRAIISAQNVDIIFTDVMNMYKLSRNLSEDLKNRLGDWDAQHSCLGDVFIKFCTCLKVYTNFLNNYEVILAAIERCREQTPTFRAFLQRHERLPELKMLTLQEMLLLPSQRISEYVTLLQWFEQTTPVSHPDRADLTSSIGILRNLHDYIKECKLRLERDREMVALQKRILNCPSLLEANRYLLKHLDITSLIPPDNDAIKPELRVYQQKEIMGAYLFNDALVLTRRTSRHFPFSRAIEYAYRFDVSVGLTRLKVTDIPDSKYISNAFKMETPRREWYCMTETGDEKYEWISVLEKTIRTAIHR